MRDMKILGSGCKKCVTLGENAKAAADAAGKKAEIIKVTHFAEIAAYGVMATPSVVIDEVVVHTGGVPTDAVGVLINLTAVGQSAGGYLSVRADGVAYSGTSNLNWVAASTTIANSCTVKCGAGAMITVRLGGAAASANVIVDVVGYYR